MGQHQSSAIKDKMILWSRDVLEHKDQYVILDTETTGLNKNDVVIQISIIDLHGNELLNSLVRPMKRKRMSAESSGIHGITMADLISAPTLGEIKPEIDKITAGKTVLIYNAEFDERLIEQTARQDKCFSPHFKTTCVMKYYSFFIQQWSDYHCDWSYQKLPSGDHSAIGDCRATLKAINEMASSEISKPVEKATQAVLTPSVSGTNRSQIMMKPKRWWQFWI
jgi:DNA polymerase III subunit epsilon